MNDTPITAGERATEKVSGVGWSTTRFPCCQGGAAHRLPGLANGSSLRLPEGSAEEHMLFERAHFERQHARQTGTVWLGAVLSFRSGCLQRFDAAVSGWLGYESPANFESTQPCGLKRTRNPGAMAALRASLACPLRPGRSLPLYSVGGQVHESS